MWLVVHVVFSSRRRHTRLQGDWSSDVFFFSSRRRHTRLQGDWSSDVCSSDLQGDWSSDVCSSDLQGDWSRSEEHTSELQSPCNLVCRLLLEKKKEAQPHHRNTEHQIHPDTDIPSPQTQSL